MSSRISIRRAENQDISALYTIMERLGYAKDAGYFEHCLELQDQGKRILFIISYDGHDAGYGILNWTPKYALFKKLGIPEIQDLNVIRDFRKKGLASELIKYCEKLAKDKGHDQMGIAFGLHNSCGAAQRLYIKMGYIPDGEGATYDRKQIAYGDFKPLDDDLCLMLVKEL